MAEFISKYSSNDFDKAMDGGFKFAQGQFLSEEQKQAFIINGNLATKDDLENSDDSSVTGLPTVTEEDNGKILQVAEGAWVTVTPTETYSKTEIDDMFGSYINEVAELLGGDA